MKNFPTQLLKEWFLENRRSLPWREEPTPYRVWISEVMLQQTQVAVVIPYFNKWMESFPSIEALAKAPIEQVLKCWEGLGYYSRARNLHQAAAYILKYYGGELPSQAEELSQIKGIGPYTQGAIRSFAFRQKAAAVDGNVRRVLGRFLALEEDIDTPNATKKLQEFIESNLPDEEPWLITEGLIELGATVCMKKARCQECPLINQCEAFRHHLQDLLPKKKQRPATTLLNRQVAVITYQGHYLLQKGERGKVMADLYEFPYLETETPHEVKEKFESLLKVELKYLKPLPFQRHGFTRYRVQLFPHLMEASRLTDLHLWKKSEELSDLPFSSGHKRVLKTLLPI